MNPVYAGLAVGLTFAGLVWFIISGQPTHLTITFVIVTLALTLGAAFMKSRELAREEVFADGEEYEDDEDEEGAGVMSEAMEGAGDRRVAAAEDLSERGPLGDSSEE